MSLNSTKLKPKLLLGVVSSYPMYLCNNHLDNVVCLLLDPDYDPGSECSRMQKVPIKVLVLYWLF